MVVGEFNLHHPLWAGEGKPNTGHPSRRAAPTHRRISNGTFTPSRFYHVRCDEQGE